ncbi:MAG: glycosyltransferase family 2 protein [Candidatus Diapherotrites archaeon]|nr:glycosyltransferase family 2 protein [Candidatus Diapherotrites archaeon]
METVPMEKLESLSIFFPAYNDGGTIKKMVLDAAATAAKVAKKFEIIVVDDRSPDNSGKIADGLAKKHSFLRVVHHKKNMGYGGALKSGFRAARHEWVFYTDGDAQYDAKELERLVEKQRKTHADVVNGYKIKRSDRRHRVILGNMYNGFSRLMFGIKIRDIDCDFRLIRKTFVDRIGLRSDSGVICIEMVKKLQMAGAAFEEVGVHHYPRTHGSSQFFRPVHILKVFYGLFVQWIRLVVFGWTRDYGGKRNG